MTGHGELVEKFNDFYATYMNEDILEFVSKFPKERQALFVDWRNDLSRFDPDLADDFRQNPDHIRQYAERALRDYDIPVDIDLSQASVLLENVGYESHIRKVGEYSEREVSNLVPVRGQVNKLTKKQMIPKEAVFECLLCGTTNEQPQPDRGYMEPNECQGCERQGPFKLRADLSVMADYQLLRLQLPPEYSNGQANEHIDITLEGQLVNEASPGDRVEVAAHLDMEAVDEEKGIFDFVGKADSIKTRETDFEDIDTKKHEEEIFEISNGDPYSDIIDSIAPGIHGHETIKLAIGLQMFGGTRKKLPDGSVERGDSHILLVGDPGVGKSVMLNFADEMAPRSIYTDGKGSTSAGLTASAVRDDFAGGQWSIEGGSLVKAHKGLACVDELDDMDEEDRSALNTALEKQEIPVSKAGITTTLPARTTLLAAANPKYGRFDSYEPVSEQVNLNPTLISRFDLVFTLRDKNDEQLDRDIIEHKATTAKVGQQIAANEEVDSQLLEQVKPEIEPEVMRAYIAYAKQNITPIFTEEASDLLVEEFAKIRQANKTEDENPEKDGATVPVTFRKQEAITRLAEASARIRLSDTVEKEDVERALRPVMQSLKDVGMDPETGNLDADMTETGRSQSQHHRVQYVKELLEDMDDPSTHGVAEEDLMEVATRGDYTKGQIRRVIKTLKDKGEIYEPKEDHYARA